MNTATIKARLDVWRGNPDDPVDSNTTSERALWMAVMTRAMRDARGLCDFDRDTHEAIRFLRGGQAADILCVFGFPHQASQKALEEFLVTADLEWKDRRERRRLGLLGKRRQP